MLAKPAELEGHGRRLAELMALALQGCTGQGDRQTMPPDGDEAVEMWVHPETLSPAVRRPIDFKAESRDVAWGLGAGASSVLRYEPSRGESGTFGLGDDPPLEVVRPARLAVAEEKSAAIDDVNQAMAAVFETKERVLEKAERRARRIEADAEKRARAEAEAVSARLIAEAQEEAQRIVEAALAVAAGSTEESILRAARLEADRLIQDARIEADRLVADAHLGGSSQAQDQSSANAPAPVFSIRPEEEPSLVIELDDAQPVADSPGDGDGDLDRRSRYERTSAGLPIVGDNGADVFDAIRRMRKGMEN